MKKFLISLIAIPALAFGQGGVVKETRLGEPIKFYNNPSGTVTKQAEITTGGEVRADSLANKAGTGAPTFTQGAIVASGKTFTLTGATLAGSPTWSGSQLFPGLRVTGDTTSTAGDITYASNTLQLRGGTGGFSLLASDGTALTTVSNDGSLTAAPVGSSAAHVLNGNSTSFKGTDNSSVRFSSSVSATYVDAVGANTSTNRSNDSNPITSGILCDAPNPLKGVGF